MADECGLEARAVVERGFKGKQRQQQIRRPADASDPAPPPCVNRRAHVVNGRYAGALQLPFEQQIEHVEVHADKGRRALGQQAPTQPEQQARQTWKLDERLREAIDRQRVHIRQRLKPCRTHGLTAHADEANAIDPAGQGAHQPRTQPITRGLASNNADGGGHAVRQKPGAPALNAETEAGNNSFDFTPDLDSGRWKCYHLRRVVGPLPRTAAVV